MKTALLITIILFIGCSSKKRGTSVIEAQANEKWERILSCNDGSVVVDFDLNNRMHMQMVLKDRSIFPIIDRDYSYGEITGATGSERVYRGESGTSGISKSSDFGNFFKTEINPSDNGSRPGFEVAREGSRLQLRSLDLNDRNCGRNIRRNNFAACAIKTYTFNNCN